MESEQNSPDGGVHPFNLLLVEDNEADVKITLRAFSKASLPNNVFVVNDGQEALDYVFRQGRFQDAEKYPCPHIVLLDINMPKVSGPEVIERMKADTTLRHIPIVILTSSKSKEDILLCYERGAASYIPKPVSYVEFVKLVEGFNYYWQVVNELPYRKKGSEKNYLQ
jgi:CheY-like chemotaxis protein